MHEVICLYFTYEASPFFLLIQNQDLSVGKNNLNRAWIEFPSRYKHTHISTTMMKKREEIKQV
jgi:hypothetical protein